VSEPLVEGQADADRGARARGRILAAARAEFAASGFGGGRVERVAAGAGINKERIYAYFGDKRGLFVATVAAAVEEVGRTVGDVGDDLSEFAGRLFDFMAAHPATLRLLGWARLEASEQMAVAAEHLIRLARPEDDIAARQAAGRISANWDARDLLLIVWALAEASHMPPFSPAGADTDAIERRRRRLVEHTVGLLAAPGTPGGGPERRSPTEGDHG
jgi:AcrR family transcriptional regulator